LEAESATMLASACVETEDFARWIALLKGRVAEACQAQEVVEENSRGLFDATTNTKEWREESKRECRELVEKLTLLQTGGSEQCLAIVGAPRGRSHLLEGMWITFLHHTEMVEQLVTLWVTMSFIMEFILGRSPNESFWGEVVDKPVAQF
jgi:hypothetical protein